MNILILGAGAIGTMLGVHFIRAHEEVTFTDRPEVLEKLLKEGVTLRSKDKEHHIGNIKTIGSKELGASQACFDLVIVAVKAYHVGDVCTLIKRDNFKNLLIIQNGVGNEEVLAPSPLFRTIKADPVFPYERFGVARPFIFYVGSITPKRHVIPLLSAFEELSPLYGDWNVILAGRNVTYPPVDIAGLVKNCNDRLGRRAVVYEEFVSDDELIALYNTAEIFAYLSTYEGFGMPPLEAMACGAPVLTTDCSSLPEVVGDAALMVDPFKPEDIKEALARLMGDEALRGELRERGYRRKEMFSWAGTAGKTLEIIKSVKRV